MKKLFIIGALIIVAIACYTFGYSFFSFDENLINLKERDYVMPQTTPAEEYSEEETMHESVDIIYSIDGSAITYEFDEDTTDNGEQ